MSENSITNISGIEELNELTKKLEHVHHLLDSLNNQTVDLENTKTFVQGPFLHQNTEESTEENSANFEKKYKQLFDYLRDLKLKIENELNG